VFCPRRRRKAIAEAEFVFVSTEVSTAVIIAAACSVACRPVPQLVHPFPAGLTGHDADDASRALHVHRLGRLEIDLLVELEHGPLAQLQLVRGSANAIGKSGETTPGTKTQARQSGWRAAAGSAGTPLVRAASSVQQAVHEDHVDEIMFDLSERSTPHTGRPVQMHQKS
jgi:hypothetical protein